MGEQLKDKDVPFFTKEDCPGALIAYWSKKREEDMEKFREMMREELKPMEKFMRITSKNQTMLYSGTVVRFVLFLILFLMTSGCGPV